MKDILLVAFAWIFIILLFAKCGANEHEISAIEQLNRMPKPVTVFSKFKRTKTEKWCQMTVQDTTGKLIPMNQFGLEQLIDKYNIGDTIK